MLKEIDTRCSTSGLLTATGAETVYDTTVAIAFTINGKQYSKATVADGATPTTDGDAAAFETLAASEGCCMVWALKADGTVGVFQGDVVALDSANEPVSALMFPDVDLETWAPFAYQTLKNGSTGSTFTFGTSNWNATGMTVVITNVGTLPPRPPTT